MIKGIVVNKRVSPLYFAAYFVCLLKTDNGFVYWAVEFSGTKSSESEREVWTLEIRGHIATIAKA